MEVTREQAREEAKKLVKDQMERHGITLEEALFRVGKAIKVKKEKLSQQETKK